MLFKTSYHDSQGKTEDESLGQQWLNADFQHQARKDNVRYLNQECQQLEENNKKRKMRDVFKEVTEICVAKIGIFKIIMEEI